MAKNSLGSVRYKATPGDVVFKVVNYTVFTIFTLICIFPFYYLFINTISNNDLVGKNMITLIPRAFTLPTILP